MKRATPLTAGPEHRISPSDYYQILTSALMVLLGVIIVSRSVSAGITLMSILVGGGFMALGGYRLKFIFKFFKERRKWNHR